MTADNNFRSETTIPLVEETINVDKQSVVTGRTRVTTRTEIIEDNVEAELDRHQVDVTRVPIGRDLALDEPVPTPRTEGNTKILPVFEEYLVVEKRLRLVEEVHITTTTSVEDVHVPVTRRRQVSDVTHDEIADPNAIHKPV